MRLHRLELRGIGPFATRFTIDFDRLSVAGIYLLDGPTGSGKSTLIDAITWALYGSVAGGEDSTSERMRSTHSDPNLESYIDLVFTVNSGTYRVRRTPSWTKAGNKNPTNVTAKLWKLYEGALESGDIDSGVLLENKAAGTGVAITELIGLNRKQFVQTIVLPQGKFAEFLRLNSSERTGLLEQVFGTELYRRVAEKLAALASTATEEVKSAKRAFAFSFDNLLEGAPLSKDRSEILRSAGVSLAAPEDASSLLGEIDSLQREVVSSHEAATLARSRAAAGLEQAHQALLREKDLAARVAARSILLERSDLLNKEATEISDLEAALDSDHKAQQLLARVEAAEEAERTVAGAHAELRQSSEITPEEVDEATLSSLEELQRAMNSLSGSLAELEKRETELSGARDQQSSDAKELAAVQRQLQKSVAAADPLPERISEARRKHEETAALFAGLTGAQAGSREAEGRSRKFAALARVRDSIAQSEAAAGRKLDSFRAAKAEHDRLTEAWIASTAANLARELHDESPCPVCGSLDHPSPAPATDSLATLQDVRGAEKLRRRQEAELQKVRTSLEALRATAATMEGDLAGLTAEEATGQFEEARAAVSAAQESGIRASQYAETIASLTQRNSELLTQAAGLREEVTALTTRMAERARRIATDEDQLTERLEGFASVQERRRAHEVALAAKNRELAAVRSWLQATHASTARQRELSKVLKASDFATGPDVRAALIAPNQASLWKERVSGHKQEVHDVLRDLASPEISSLTGTEEAHVSQAQEAREVAAQRHEAASAVAATSGVAVDQVTARAERVRDHLRLWAQAKDSAGPIVRLAGLANANSEFSFTRTALPTYVLSQRFKLVVEQANQHLAVFSLGRYELVSTEEREKGSRAQKVGLGLEIIDHAGDATGDVRRATKSLSGGETFYVSLSLALALADVVCSENGGIQLDTLMIDEGFGTLDESTRDQVMQVLTSLATNGRAVAVVSHVEELKKMIAEQIVVRPLPDGSSSLEVRA